MIFQRFVGPLEIADCHLLVYSERLLAVNVMDDLSVCSDHVASVSHLDRGKKAWVELKENNMAKKKKTIVRSELNVVFVSL